MVSLTDIMSLLPILFHRVGLILSITSSVILIVIPRIYNQVDDLRFASRLSRWMIALNQFGLAILVITGIFRLLVAIPSGFVFKLLAVIITLIWATFRTPVYPAEDYQLNYFVLFFLICLSAIIGILL